MKIYEVGGCVRDRLLGKEPKDIDYVIVGATEADIEKMLADGFKKVGADFPVFICPKTGSEYALARRERKTGAGYNGFECETDGVTLEEDLSRRDITINAMAWDGESGKIIDPFGGFLDIKRRVIRHVSDAFREDPVRVLRVARLSARYNFSVEPKTLDLMKEMVRSGELNSLTPERVFLELEKVISNSDGLGADWFFQLIDIVGAFEIIFKQKFTSFPYFLSRGEYRGMPVRQRFAYYFGEFPEEKLREMKFPSEIIELCELIGRIKFTLLGISWTRSPESFVDICRIFRLTSKIDRFNEAAVIAMGFSRERFVADSLRMCLMLSDLNTASRIIAKTKIDPSLKGDMDIKDYVKSVYEEAIRKEMFD